MTKQMQIFLVMWFFSTSFLILIFLFTEGVSFVNDTVVWPCIEALSVPACAQSKLPTCKVVIGHNILNAELASTMKQQCVGMMFRTDLTDEAAMYFPFKKAHQAQFYNKNAPAMDLAFIKGGKVVEIHYLNAGDKTDKLSLSAVDGALECNAGYFGRHNVVVGSEVNVF